MQAIILAAGMGKRLKDLTSNATKCMVEVYGDYMQIPPPEKRINHAPEILDFGEEESTDAI